MNYKIKYGATLRQLSERLGISKETFSTWDKQGFDRIDIWNKAKQLNAIRKNKFLQRCWGNMKTRCENTNNKAYKYYGGKGIQVNLDKNDLLFLWERDNATNLKQPSIDRIDSSKNYELSNCRFIEWKENKRAKKPLRTLKVK